MNRLKKMMVIPVLFCNYSLGMFSPRWKGKEPENSEKGKPKKGAYIKRRGEEEIVDNKGIIAGYIKTEFIESEERVFPNMEKKVVELKAPIIQHFIKNGEGKNIGTFNCLREPKGNYCYEFHDLVEDERKIFFAIARTIIEHEEDENVRVVAQQHLEDFITQVEIKINIRLYNEMAEKEARKAEKEAKISSFPRRNSFESFFGDLFGKKKLPHD